MTEQPTVIANQAHLPGLRMPGDYLVDFDPESGWCTVMEGPEEGKTFLPEPLVVEAMRKALDPEEDDVINESVISYEQEQ